MQTVRAVTPKYSTLQPHRSIVLFTNTPMLGYHKANLILEIIIMALNPTDANELKSKAEFNLLMELLIQPTRPVENEARLKELIALNPRNENDDPALVYAAKTQQWNILEELAKLGADLSVQGQHGFTALMHAAMAGKLDIVKMLVSLNENWNTVDNQGHTPLMGAIISGKLDVVKWLAGLPHCDHLHAKDKYSFTALTYATKAKEWNIVKELVMLGATFAKDENGLNTLMHAALAGKLDIVQEIVEKLKNVFMSIVINLNVNDKDNQDCTALIHAANAEKWDVVEALLALPHLNVNLKNKEGHTALMFAAFAGKLDVAKTLLQKNADVNAKDNRGLNAITHAAKGEKWNIVKELSPHDENGFTDLMYAIFEGNLEGVKELATPNINLEARDKYGRFALMLAASLNRLDIVEYLVKNLGANVNAIANDESTSLMLMAILNQLDTVKGLITLGADLTIKNKNGHTALMLAEHANSREVVTFLEEFLEQKLNLSPSLSELTRLLRKPNLSSEDESTIHALLETSVSPNALVGPYQAPALVYALRKNNVKAAEILIAQGADKKCLEIKQPSYADETLLCFFAKKRFSPTDTASIRFLCDNGTSLDIGSGPDQDTPMAIARQCRNTLFIQITNTHATCKNASSSEEEVKSGKECGTSKETSLQLQSIDMARTIKEAGHIIGFTSKISNINPVGYFSLESYQLLKKCLIMAEPTIPEHLKTGPISEALDLAIEWLKADGIITHKQLLEHYDQGNPVILPVGYPGHAFPIIAWNNIFIVCNRGEKKLEYGISVFKIPDVEGNPGKITGAFLQTILPEIGRPTSVQVFQGIEQLIDVKKPLLVFPSQDQKRGTCGFVNLKSSMQPLLCFMELLQAGPKPTTCSEFNSTFLEPYLIEDNVPLTQTLKLVMQNARMEYKAFTNQMRTQKIDALCQTFNLPSSDRKMYLEMFEAIITAHQGQLYAQLSARQHTAERMQAEKQRVETIVKVLSETEKRAILTPFFVSNIRTSDRLEANLWLAKLGADVNAQNENGYTALMDAVMANRLDIVKELVNLGADLNIKGNDDRNRTALMYAEMYQNEDIITFLKETEPKRMATADTTVTPGAPAIKTQLAP